MPSSAKTRHRAPAALLLAAPALCLAQAQPQPTTAAGGAYAGTLAPVVVSSTRTETIVFDTPASVDSIDGDTMRDRQPQVDLAESLTGLAGMQIQDRQNDAQDLQISIRGFGARSTFGVRGVRLYVDGIPATMPDGQGQTSNIEIATVERVEVLRGPNALLNGMAPYGSLGGAINLVPKRAGATPLNRLTLSYIGKRQFGAHADIGRRFGENQAWGVRVNALGQNGDSVVKGGRERLGALTLGVDYQGERARMAVDVNYQDRLTRVRSGLMLAPAPGIGIPPVPNARSTPFPDWTFWDAKDVSGTVRGEFDVTPDWTVYAAAGSRRHDFKSLQTTFLMQDSAGGLGTIPSALTESLTSVTGEAGLRGRFRTGPLQHEPVLSVSALGLDYNSQRVRTSTVSSNLYDPVDIAPPNVRISGPLPRATENRLRSVALADTISFADGQVQVTAGLRHQQVEAMSFDAVTGNRTSRYQESAVTPAFAVVLRPTDRLALYANVIQGLNQGAVAPTTAINAGEIFAPEVSRQREVGIKYDTGNLAASLSAFQITRPSSYLDSSTLRFTVDGRQRNRGLELLVQGEPLRGVRVLGGAAYTDARLVRTANGANDGNRAPAVSRLQFNASAEWDTPFLEGLTLTARVLRTGRQYVDAANTQSIPGWTRVDVGARYAFDAGGTPMVVRAAIENVFDRNYWQSAAREGLQVAAPITALLSVSAEF